MKKYIVLIMLLSLPLMADTNYNKLIIGTWHYQVQNDTGYLEFTNDKFTDTSSLQGFIGVFGYKIEKDKLHTTRIDTDKEIEVFKIVYMSNDVLILISNERNIKLERLKWRKK